MFDKETVDEIKRLLRETHISQSQIADRFFCSPMTISRINKGETYKEVGEEYPIRSYRNDQKKVVCKSDDKRLPDYTTIEKIIEELRTTKRPQYEIAMEYGTNEQFVSKINRGKTKYTEFKPVRMSKEELYARIKTERIKLNKPIKDIAKKYDIHVSTVSRVSRREDVEMLEIEDLD